MLPSSHAYSCPGKDVVTFLAWCRAALRASCKANKAVVDAHVHEGRFHGVARHMQESTLPAFIKGVHVSAQQVVTPVDIDSMHCGAVQGPCCWLGR